MNTNKENDIRDESGVREGECLPKPLVSKVSGTSPIPQESPISKDSDIPDSSIDLLLTAFEDWLEARTELNQMKSEYTGYSPSYHLQSWIDMEDKAKNQVREALKNLLGLKKELNATEEEIYLAKRNPSGYFRS
jgi:hypothetical protein